MYFIISNVFNFQAIQEDAEDNAEKFVFQKESLNNYTYYSCTYSNISDPQINKEITDLIKKFPSLKSNKQMYRKMTMDNDTHFYNLMVNTTHSAVHVPINIYDKGKYLLLLVNKIYRLQYLAINYNCHKPIFCEIEMKLSSF